MLPGREEGIELKNERQEDNPFLSALLDASMDGILAFDRECRYTGWNRAMERISGVSREEVLGRYAFEVFPFLKETGEHSYFNEALAGRRVISKDRPYTVPETGREGFFEAHYSPLYSEGGEVDGGVAVVRDITERKGSEAAAQGAHQRLIFHVENSPLAVIEWDSDFRVSRWSASSERLFGWKAEEVLGKQVGDWQFVVGEDVDAVDQATDRQRQGVERQGVLRNRNFKKDGSVLYCEWYNSVLNDDSGKLVSVLSLVLDVTARKLAEEERARLLVCEREARREVEEANRLKDEFLATLSHELRTPLTSVLGWASMMRAGDVHEADFDRAIETIERNSRSLARLIDDLLDVSRIITGNLHLDVRPIDLAPIIESAKDAVRPAARAKDIRLQMEFDSGVCTIRGDRNRIQQVVWNLLFNAIKFTPQGGSVEVRLERTDAFARLIVSDTGEGISAEFLPYVFDRFRQAEGSSSRKQGGLGLGLAVVRHLVELHGGRVLAESRGRGHGASFTVELPLAADPREVSETKNRNQTVVRRWGSGSPARLDGLRVLLVENDDDTRALLSMMLRPHGADVTSASSAAEALQVLEAALPDVLISDIGMPDKDGYELMRQVRALPPERGGLVPAIALTGYAGAKDQKLAISAGYQLHMAKPLEAQELVAAVASLAERTGEH